MILLPAIDLHEGKCVRLFRGDYDTAEVVAQDPLSTAKRFQEQGARWLHMVDLDGAKDGKPQNQQLIFDVVENTDLHVEVGGGIRDMDTVEYYLNRGVSRVILGSAALWTAKWPPRAGWSRARWTMWTLPRRWSPWACSTSSARTSTRTAP